MADDEDRTVEMSSENSGPTTRSRSEEDLEGEDHEMEEEEEEEEDGSGNKGNKRKRKKYHRHTTDQIRHMEAYDSSLTITLYILYFISMIPVN